MAPDTELEDDAQVAIELGDQIHSLLAGRGSLVQATVITEIIATFLVGWPAQARAEMLSSLMNGAINMAAELEPLIHGPQGHPSNDGRG